MTTAKDPCSQLGSLCHAVTQIAGVVAISRAVTPTHRRALAVARRLLEADGRLDLHERLLGAIGAEHADEARLADATSAAVSAARIEAALGIGSDMSEEFRALLPRFVAGGIADMVRAGTQREAMLPALASLSLSGSALDRSGDASNRRGVNELVVTALRFGQLKAEPWDDRVALVQRLAQDLAELVPFGADTESTRSTSST